MKGMTTCLFRRLWNSMLARLGQRPAFRRRRRRQQAQASPQQRDKGPEEEERGAAGKATLAEPGHDRAGEGWGQ
jgi:flagellar biosynthesis/type III secretory pathway M-ring protein FliF/YscJ